MHPHGENYDGEDNARSSFDVPIHMLIVAVTVMMLHFIASVTSLDSSRLSKIARDR
jgi:hypothetical protein